MNRVLLALALLCAGIVASPAVAQQATPSPGPATSASPCPYSTGIPQSLGSPGPGQATPTAAQLAAAISAALAALAANPSVANMTPNPSVTPMAVPSGCVPPSPSASGSPGSLSQLIYQAAQAFYGTNTSALFGAAGDFGVNACALSVSAILQTAIGFTNGSASVNTLFSNISSSGQAKSVSQGQAQPGDVVIAYDNHVGICMNVGCTKILSNSSSTAKFIWQSGSQFDGSFPGASFSYWHFGS